MQLLPIQSNQFPQWKELRDAVYGSLDGEGWQWEMERTLARDDWFCYFLADSNECILGLVELSSRNIVDGCSSSPVAYNEKQILARTQAAS